jgi:DNA-3-methyladenine glycosylase I
MSTQLLVTGDDGIDRCGWASADPEYRRYHDEEWGAPVHGDGPLFEIIALEGFQAGLSWITILKKRPAFRAAFDGFDIGRVASFDAARAERLAEDAGIIRNRAKIAATIENAGTIGRLITADPGALDRLIWSFAPASHARPRTVQQLVTATEQSTALSSALRKRGFKFVGPTTMHALMQAAGLINDHAVGCTRGDQLERSRR